MERVHSAGAKFAYEKARWFNHEWIKKLDVRALQPLVQNIFQEKGMEINEDNTLSKIMELVKDRCTLLTDFYEQAAYFFQAPQDFDLSAIQPKWNDAKNLFFAELIRNYQLATIWNAQELEHNFKDRRGKSIKPGEVMLPLRIMLVGGKFGPGEPILPAVLGKDETIRRMEHVLNC